MIRQILATLVVATGIGCAQLTVDSQGNVGGTSFKSSGTAAGTVDLPQGPVPSTFPLNSFSLVAPASIPTSYQWYVPASPCTGYVYVQAGQLSCQTGTGGGGGGGVPPWEASPVTPPALASWTFINPGGNGTTSDVQGGVEIVSPSGDNTKQLYIAAPSGAFTLTTHINAQCPAGSNWPATGIFVADAGDNHVVDWELTNHAGVRGLRVVDWASSVPTGNNVPFGDVAIGSGDFWQRIQYTGTQFNMQLSPTGTAGTWQTYYTVSSTTWLVAAPVRIGFLAYAQLTGMACVAVLDSWSVTQP